MTRGVPGRGTPTSTKYERQQRSRRVEDLLYFVHRVNAKRVKMLAEHGLRRWPSEPPERIAERLMVEEERHG